MTAQDVEWNFQRYLHLGDFAEGQEGPCCTFKSVKWESVTATDDNTVVFKLQEPNIDTLTILFTSYSPHILPREVVEEHGLHPGLEESGRPPDPSCWQTGWTAAR